MINHEQNMSKEKEYFAFISYKSEDVEWATWLQHELEHYHLPASFNGRTDVPQELRPVFRDIDELSAGNLPEQIKQALVNSQNLIVICSPQAAKSPWVNEEVETFIALGRTERIFPFIVEGNSPSEFFPPALLNLPKNEERLGGDVSKKGRDAAFIKVVAGMLGVGFDSLWNRYEKEKAEEERKQREQRENLLRVQSHFLAEKAQALIADGDSYTARLLALEALPKNFVNLDRPYVAEAETALRASFKIEDVVLRGHQDIVNNAIFSSDGSKIYSCSKDGSIAVWNRSTGRQTTKLKGHDGSVNCIALSRDENFLVSGSDDGKCYVWDLEKNEVIKTFAGHRECVQSISVSPDGKKVVSVSSDSFIAMWDLYSNEELLLFNGRGYGMAQNSQVTFSPDGNEFASIHSDKMIRIWDANKGVLKRTIEQKSVSSCRFIAYDHTGKYIVAANSTGITSPNGIKIWDSDSCKLIAELSNSDMINSLSFSRDGNSIIAADINGFVKIWDIHTRRLIYTKKIHNSPINYVSYNADETSFMTASSDSTIRIIQLYINDTVEIIKKVSLEEGRVFFSHDREHYFVIDKKTNQMFKYDLKNEGILVDKIKYNNDFNNYQISPNGKYYMIKNSSNILIINADTGNIQMQLQSPERDDCKEYFSPNGKCILMVKKDWDMVYKDGIYQGMIWIKHFISWDIETNQHIVSWRGENDETLVDCQYIPDFNKIVTVYKNILTIYDYYTGNLTNRYLFDLEFSKAFFNKDGSLIIAETLNNNLIVIDTNTGNIISVVEQNDGFLSSHAFSQNGKMMATISLGNSSDYSINIWDLVSGIPLDGFVTKENCLDIIFGKNGVFILTFDQSTYFLKQWKLKTIQELIQKTQICFQNAPLTAEDRKKYYIF